MFRTNPNLRSIAVLISLLAVCLIGAGLLRANLTRTVTTGRRSPTITIAGSIPAAGIRSVAFTDSGDRLCTISKDGAVVCYDPKGAEIFSASVPGADSAVITPDGDYTLVYSRLDPTNTKLVFLDYAGEEAWWLDVSGAIWSADAGWRDGCACFAVGTGKRYVYIVTVGSKAKRYRRWKTPGAVCSVALDPESDSVAYGTWQDSSIGRSDLYGHRDWRSEADPASLQHVQSLAGSQRLFVRSIPNRSDTDGEAAFVDPDGAVLGSCPITASKLERAVASPDGAFVCVGYSKSIQHSDKSMPEMHAVLYDYTGRRLWDKGSMLMQITPILVASGGYVLVDSGKGNLLVINASGETKQSCKLPAAPVNWATSNDGSQALVTCSNGRAYLLRIAQ